MEILELKTGEHYRYRGQRFQIVEIHGDSVQLRAIEGPKIVLRQTITVLYRATRRGDFVKVQEAPVEKSPHKILAGLPKPYALAFERRWHYVRTLMAQLHGHMPAERAQLLISKLAAQINDISAPSLSTARNWVRAFRQSGQSCLALIPGKRRKDKHRLDRQPAEFQQIINQQLGLLYLKREPARKTEVIDSIVEELEAFNADRPADDKLPVPSTSTLNRILREVDAYQLALTQLGSKYAQKRHDWTCKRPRPRRLFELVEADTQELHVMVVDKDGEVIGRPYLTVFLEVRTRMVIAWTIAFNPPSLDTTLQAFKLSISSENPYGGIGLRYIFDSGPEFIEQNLRRIIAMLGGEVCYCEPAAGNQKPHVEAFFGVWSKEIAHVMPGTTFSNVTSRGAYNSEKNACLTLAMVRETFRRWLTEVYHERVHSNLNKPPRVEWEAVYSAMFPPRRFSPSELNQHFWSAFEATPQKGRLRHNSLFWTGPAVGYLANRQPKVTKLLVYYDPSDLGRAWVCHPAYPDELLELQAVDPGYQDGLTMHLHHLTLKNLRTARKAFDSTRARHARIEILRELAKVKTPAQRRQHQCAAEKGSLQRKARSVGARTLDQHTNTAPVTYLYHEDTPDDYSSAEV